MHLINLDKMRRTDAARLAAQEIRSRELHVLNREVLTNFLAVHEPGGATQPPPLDASAASPPRRPLLRVFDGGRR